MARMELIDPVKASDQGGFPASGRPDEGGDLPFGNIKADVMERMGRPVVKIKIPDLEFRVRNNRPVRWGRTFTKNLIHNGFLKTTTRGGKPPSVMAGTRSGVAILA
jgi:hypothetical protein